MKKFVFGFLCFCFWVLPVYSFTLKGGVTFTVESARKEAFANVEYSLPKSIIDANRIDPNFEDNKVLIKNGISETGDRYIGYFDDGGYGIVYKKNLFNEYYYNKNGILEAIGKRTSTKFPTKCYKYDTNGQLITIILYVDQNNSYTFSPDGQLTSHWINNIGYDKNGKIIGRCYK